MSKEVVLSRTSVGRYHRTTISESVRKFLEIKEGVEVEWVFNTARSTSGKLQVGEKMAKLLILGPSYWRNTSQEPLPAIERYDGVFYRIVRRNVGKVEEKGIDIIIVTEDLEVVAPETKLPYKPLVGDRWRTTPPTTRDPEKIEKLRNQILEIVKNKRYDEIFIALNRHYQQILPDLTPYTREIMADFKGLGPKASSLKE